VKRGVVEAPHRIVDVLPTILELIGWPHDPASMDGRAIRGIYE
jgi:arylsulfatase A-like enzyme